jgi:hypothetical protein
VELVPITVEVSGGGAYLAGILGLTVIEDYC